MKKANAQNSESDSDETVRQKKRRYSSPKLLHFGMITGITQGSSNGGNDGAQQGGNMAMMMSN